MLFSAKIRSHQNRNLHEATDLTLTSPEVITDGCDGADNHCIASEDVIHAFFPHFGKCPEHGKLMTAR